MSTQSDARIRFEQGLDGALAVASGVDVLVVVVDVLSFSTCVSVAADRGVVVIPARWGDERAEEIAERYDAQLAGPRSGNGISLSPLSIRSGDIGPRLVLPSPNGATICAELAGRGTVIAGCLRNISAVAHACEQHLARGPHSDVALVAAGERWSGESLRSAPEDVWGAGAIIERIGRDDLTSMEALVAADAYRTALERGLPLDELTSGRELVERGFAADVQIAAELDWSSQVPHLVHGAFVS